MQPTPIHTQLRTILTHLYPTRADLARVAHDAGVPLERVPLGNSAVNDWDALLSEAGKQQGIALLLDVAVQEYPQNRDLLETKTAFDSFTQAILVSSLPTGTIHLLNFARELTVQQQQNLDVALGQRVLKVIHRPAHFEDARPYGPQCVALAESVGLTASEWQSLPIVVNPPGFTPGALCLLSELHGRIGHFPSAMRLRPVAGSNPSQFEVAEVMNLQALRNAARDGA